MDAVWALCSIAGIVGVVLIGGYMMAALVNMVKGAFSGNAGSNKKSADVLDYTDYKTLDNTQLLTENKTQTFTIDETKVKEESKAIETSSTKENEFKFDEITEDGDLEKIEARLQAQKQAEAQIDAKSEESNAPMDLDDEDIDLLLEGISNDVIEDTKEQITVEDEEAVKPSNLLDSYNIDEVLDNLNEEPDEEAEVAPVEETKVEETPVVEETKVEEVPAIEETVAAETTTEEVEPLSDEVTEEETFEETEEEVVEEEPVVTPVVEEDLEAKAQEEARKQELESLKRQVEELNRQLEAARATVNTVVTTEVVIDMTEEECLNRIATLDERLKNLRKDYKTNLKEYKPLKRVRENLEKYQTKLRRREAVAAKKKVALYGVNNYVDIDKDKAEKLANELELLDGLRLSVQHCEEVIESSKDRYPILENTNNILEEQIANTEADLNELQIKLEKIREGKGEGSNNQ